MSATSGARRVAIVFSLALMTAGVLSVSFFPAGGIRGEPRARVQPDRPLRRPLRGPEARLGGSDSGQTAKFLQPPICSLAW